MTVAIVGGGPAGMMAAIAAAQSGAQAVLLEKNEKCGKKLYITGKGRCNVTNQDVGDAFLSNVVRNPRFLLSALSRFDSADLRARLEQAGLTLKVERGGRVFPASDKASDVTKTLLKLMERHGVTVRCGVEVRGVAVRDGAVYAVKTGGGEIPCDRLILCTGGVSYPSTGSTGDGHRMARETGHQVVPLSPSLVGIRTVEPWPMQAQGLTLKNVVLVARRGKKKLYEEQGELLFTHFGISGPLALSLSAVLSGSDLADVQITIDLKPALEEATLEARVMRDFDEAKNKLLANAMAGLLPASMIGPVLLEAGVPQNTVVHQITKAQRQAVVAALKGMRLTPSGLLPIEEAIVTRGGVAVKDVDPKTMQSKHVRGLYFAGELLDVDAFTGGYNLQIAFTTGWCAGISAAEP